MGKEWVGWDVWEGRGWGRRERVKERLGWLRWRRGRRERGVGLGWGEEEREAIKEERRRREN